MHSTATERAKYQKIWGVDAYRVHSPGFRQLASALKWMQPEPGSSITDWGAGSGQASDALAKLGYAVRLVDIASNAYRGTLPMVESCLWELPEDMEATDYGYCADVMEHIPTDKVPAVFDQIAARTRKAVYFQIALFHDSTFTDAGPLHLSVFPADWWFDKLRASFKSVDTHTLSIRHALAVASK